MAIKLILIISDFKPSSFSVLYRYCHYIVANVLGLLSKLKLSLRLAKQFWHYEQHINQ